MGFICRIITKSEEERVKEIREEKRGTKWFAVYHCEGVISCS